MVDWSEGQPFEFHSEHSGLYEDVVMDGWDDDPPRERLSTTGDRHDSVATIDGVAVRWGRASRDDLARRRKSDEAFRRGLVWVDCRSGEEIPLEEAGLNR